MTSERTDPAGATRRDRNDECVSCGSSSARPWHTPDGVARLCHPCATLHGLGCP